MKFLISMLCAALCLAASPELSAKRSKKKTVTMSWDMWTVNTSGQPEYCDTAAPDGRCLVQVQLVLREGSVRLFTYDLGRMSLETFLLEAWGKCSRKLKKKGQLCGPSNFDCGDSCYADVNVARFKKGQLFIERYESCRGGEECSDSPTLISQTSFPNIKVKVR